MSRIRWVEEKGQFLKWNDRFLFIYECFEIGIVYSRVGCELMSDGGDNEDLKVWFRRHVALAVRSFFGSCALFALRSRRNFILPVDLYSLVMFCDAKNHNGRNYIG